ncbi:MAG: MFS transporter, partial [Bacteroidota bacterium]
SLVFYNAFLPEIAEEKDQDHVSALGFSLGYIGSVLLLIVNLVMIMKPTLFGLEEGKLPAQLSFLTVGIWWALFAQITFSALRSFQKGYNQHLIKREKSYGSIWGGYTELRKVWNQLKQLKRLRYFLFAFFFYSMALQTVMYIATLFGTDELHLETTQLILTVLIIQLVAIGGAYLFSGLSKRLGNISALRIAIFIWVIICLMAFVMFKYLATDEETKSNCFYVIALCVGMVIGGTQSLSRSTYSKLLPETEDHASFFSFYDVSEKLAIVIGTITYGLIYEITGSMLNSILAFSLFFLIGMLGLFRVKKEMQSK